MGWHSKKNDHSEQQQNLDPETPESSPSASSRSCSSALSRLFSLRCFIIMVLSIAILLSVIFWLFTRRSPSNDAVKVIGKGSSASIEAYFRLHKPASEVISHKRRLENDIFQNIGLPNTNVTILSMKQSNKCTDVKFAVLPNSTDHAISNHSLSSLRSSFVNLFTLRSNLNLTKSSFGKPTAFQVLKFPREITIDPLSFNPLSKVVEILIKFSLGISLSEIQECLAQLTDQVEQTLCSEPHESIHFIFTNKKGSTVSPPVTVKVAVVSTMRKHHHKRLEHFAQIVQTSKNLGLDSSLFGEVKSVTVSTYLVGEIIDSASILQALPPTT